MAVGRGEGNSMHNRQEPSRNNLQDRQGTLVDEETLAMAQKSKAIHTTSFCYLTFHI